SRRAGRGLPASRRAMLFASLPPAASGGAQCDRAAPSCSASRSIRLAVGFFPAGADYVDLAHVHSCDEIDRLLDPNLHEAFDRLRQAGKARFLGFSSHTPNLAQVAGRAIDSGGFDVMMLA